MITPYLEARKERTPLAGPSQQIINGQINTAPCGRVTLGTFYSFYPASWQSAIELPSCRRLISYRQIPDAIAAKRDAITGIIIAFTLVDPAERARVLLPFALRYPFSDSDEQFVVTACLCSDPAGL